MSQPVDQARRLLAEAERIAVIGHQRPDGDSIGSMLGLTAALLARGQQAVAVAGGGIPGRFRFLPGADQVVRQSPGESHLLVAVDSAEADRLSVEPNGEVAINFDHHPTNGRYAQIDLVYPEAASTTEVLFRLAPELELPLDAEVATCLLTGLLTDTIGFRTPSVTAGVLRVAADLVELGADLSVLYRRSLIERSFVALRYWGAGLATLQRQGELAWASLRLEDRKQIGYPGEDDADLIEQLGTIREANVTLIFVEQKDGKVKVSWRAHRGVDVAELAVAFGGGGHHLAAGAVVEGSLSEVTERVINATQSAMENTTA